MSAGQLVREERGPYLLGLLRFSIAALLLFHVIKLGRTLVSSGYFADVFHVPLLPEALVPSYGVYAALLALEGLACVLCIVGVAARPALLLAAVIGLYCLACDRLQFHNNRYTLLLVAFLVPWTPCDRSFMPLSRFKVPAGPAPRWAATLIGAQISLVYLSSSLGKLLDPDWRGGTVMLLRFRPVQQLDWVPQALSQLMMTPWFATVASLAAIATELFLGLGMWFGRTRAAALWLGVVFHTGIELIAHVELFSYTMLCGYVVFARPELAERRLQWRASGALADALARAWRWLDFLKRFEHQRAPAQQTLCVVVDREGQPHRGLAALRELSRATPLLFPLWLPLRLLTFRRNSAQG